MSAGKHLGKGSTKPILPDDGVLRLYSMRYCPYAQRAHLVLNAKQIPYHSIYINLTEKPEWLVEVSPLGKVPALEVVTDEGKTTSLIESLVISEYLDEKYEEKPLLPKDPLKKAQHKIIIERFSSVGNSFGKALLFGGAVEDIWNNLDTFEEILTKLGTDYFNGNEIGYVDYMLWPWFERLDGLQYVLGEKAVYDKQRFGQLVKWAELVKNDDAVKRFFVDTETHVKFWKSRKTDKPNYDLLADE